MNQVLGPSVPNKQWVVNLSSTPYLNAQETPLAHGPNFAVAPKTPPYKEYIIATALSCQSLNPTEPEEFRADIFRILRQSYNT